MTMIVASVVVLVAALGGNPAGYNELPDTFCSLDHTNPVYVNAAHWRNALLSLLIQT